MKTVLIVVLAVVALALAADTVPAQDGIVRLEGITNSYNPYAISAGSLHTIYIRYNLSGNAVPGEDSYPWWGSNGFEIYSPDGADWVSLTGTMQPLVSALSCTKYGKHYLFDGASWTRTAGNGTTPASGTTGPISRAGYSLVTWDAEVLNGYMGGTDNDIAVSFAFETHLGDANKTICFDTCAAIIAWEWSNGTEDFPVWDNGLGVSGPRCWQLLKSAIPGVYWCGGSVGNIAFGYCVGGSLNLCGYEGTGGSVIYEFAPGYETGFGALNALTGLWTWSGATVPTSGYFDIVFRASDGMGIYAAQDFVLHVAVTEGDCNCCTGRVGDINASGTDEPTIADVSTLIDHLFISGAAVTCLEEADVNVSGGATPHESDITISDISSLIDYLFITGPETGVLPDCP